MNGLGWFALLGMAAITFPLSFCIARLCLAGVIRILDHPKEKSPDPSTA